MVAIETTLSRTTLGDLEVGDRVNLEPALALGAPLGGHLVQGHVDLVGVVVSVEEVGVHYLIDFSLLAIDAEVTILLGTITMNGLSVTINAIPAPELPHVVIIT